MKTHLATKQFAVKAGKKILFEGLDLQFSPGEIWGILGANGSGKTTLLQTLGGLLPTAQGEIFLLGENLRHLSARRIAQHVGILFQDFNAHFDQTVWQYCAASRYPHLPYFGSMSSDERALIANALEITDLISKTDQSVKTLSGGERQRLAIASVLAQTPQIYLLDEPVNHLDLRHQIRIMQYLKELAEKDKHIICMSLHDINLAMYFCNKLLLLFADATVLQGCTKEIGTAINLTRLYGHPIKQVTRSDSFWWFDI